MSKTTFESALNYLSKNEKTIKSAYDAFTKSPGERGVHSDFDQLDNGLKTAWAGGVMAVSKLSKAKDGTKAETLYGGFVELVPNSANIQKTAWDKLTPRAQKAWTNAAKSI